MFGNALASKVQCYRQTAMETRSAPQLLVDLCDGAVSAIERAQDAGEAATRRVEISRARRIVAALQDALNIDTGGTVAVDLFRHYAYLTRTLIEAEQSPLSADLETIRGKLEALRDTWIEAVRIYEEQGYVAQAG